MGVAYMWRTCVDCGQFMKSIWTYKNIVIPCRRHLIDFHLLRSSINEILFKLGTHNMRTREVKKKVEMVLLLVATKWDRFYCRLKFKGIHLLCELIVGTFGIDGRK